MLGSLIESSIETIIVRIFKVFDYIKNLFGIFTTLSNSIVGAIAGYLVLWSVYWLFKLVTGKEGMGYGDFKLLAAIGAWLGWSLLPLVIMLSSVVGAVVGITLIIVARHGRNKQGLHPYPLSGRAPRPDTHDNQVC